MTVLEELVEEGRVEGRAEVLEQLLRARFGPLAEGTRERLRGASREEHERWTARLLSAGSLAEVFAP